MLIKTDESPVDFVDLAHLRESCVKNGVNYRLLMDRLSREMRKMNNEEVFSYELRAAKAAQDAKDEIARAECRRRGSPELAMIVDARIDARMVQRAGTDWANSKSDVKFVKDRNLATIL